MRPALLTPHLGAHGPINEVGGSGGKVVLHVDSFGQLAGQSLGAGRPDIRPQERCQGEGGGEGGGGEHRHAGRDHARPREKGPGRHEREEERPVEEVVVRGETLNSIRPATAAARRRSPVFKKRMSWPRATAMKPWKITFSRGASFTW